MMKTLFLLLFSVFLTTPTYSEESSPEGMVLIPKGLFQMGSKKSMLELRPHDLFNTDRHTLGPENPAHEVYLDDFYIDIYEVTNGAYAKYVKETIKEAMLSISKSEHHMFSIPLKVNINTGYNWGEAH